VATWLADWTSPAPFRNVAAVWIPHQGSGYTALSLISVPADHGCAVLQNRGTDIGTADLAERRLIGFHQVSGWWKHVGALILRMSASGEPELWPRPGSGGARSPSVDLLYDCC
jgi:hypothetical protein